MSTDFLIIAAFVVVVLAVFAAPWTRKYLLTDTGIEIRLFGKVLERRVRYDNIAEIEILSTAEAWFPWNAKHVATYKGANRITGPFVRIRQKSARINRYILISPPNPDEFVRSLRQHI